MESLTSPLQDGLHFHAKRKINLLNIKQLLVKLQNLLLLLLFFKILVDQKGRKKPFFLEKLFFFLLQETNNGK